MTCNGCGNQQAISIRLGEGWEICDKCGNFTPAGVPDVYFRRPYLDPHLVDCNNPAEKNGVWITSKKQKAERMRRLGVREAGDAKHGARNIDPAAIRLSKEKGFNTEVKF